MRLRTYWQYWKTSASLSAQTSLENRKAAVFFLSGKFLRFFLFLGFLTIIHAQIDQVSGFTLNQMITFFLIFNVFDLIGQIFFRGIYWFRDQVISGEFDFRLVKPLNSLFQALTRQTDVLDIPLLILVVIFLITQNLSISLAQLAITLVMIIAALCIITSIHILVAALGVITTEVDHTIMIFRDLSNMARFPIDIYTPRIQSILTFVIPIGIAFTFPAKALLGMLSVNMAVLSLGIGIASLLISYRVWKYALTQYSSASS